MKLFLLSLLPILAACYPCPPSQLPSSDQVAEAVPSEGSKSSHSVHNCKFLNPSTDAVRHPESDAACGDGKPGWMIKEGCTCAYTPKDRDSNGCPTSYYVKCKLDTNTDKNNEKGEEHAKYENEWINEFKMKPKWSKCLGPFWLHALNQTSLQFDMISEIKITLNKLEVEFGQDPQKSIVEKKVESDPTPISISIRVSKFPPAPGTPCPEAKEIVKEEMEKGGLMDYPIPMCDPDGKYQVAQCGLVVGCWCVDPETGEKDDTKDADSDCEPQPQQLIPIPPGAPPMPESDFAEDAHQFPPPPGTPCSVKYDLIMKEMEKGLVDYPMPSCTDDGRYLAKQCDGFIAMDDGKILCWCVDEGTGERDDSKDVDHDCLPQPKQLIPIPPGSPPAPKPEPEPVPEPDFVVDSVPFPPPPGTPCSVAKEIIMVEFSKGLVDYPTPTCTKDGKYEPVQCGGFSGVCWCVDPETGKEIEGSSRLPGAGDPPCVNVELVEPPVMVDPPEPPIISSPPEPDFAEDSPPFPPPPGTPCPIAREIIMVEFSKGLVDYAMPSCTKDGDYEPVQCGGFSGACWCVDPDSGIQIESTMRSSANPGPLDCGPVVLVEPPKPPQHNNEMSKTCEEQRKAALLARELILGVFVPQCDDTGIFNHRQCHGSTGHCWCVEPETGMEIDGSRRPPGTEDPPCINIELIEPPVIVDPPEPPTPEILVEPSEVPVVIVDPPEPPTPEKLVEPSEVPVVIVDSPEPPVVIVVEPPEELAQVIDPIKPQEVMVDPVEPPPVAIADPIDPPVVVDDPTEPPVETEEPTEPPVVFEDTTEPPAVFEDTTEHPVVMVDPPEPPVVLVDPTEPPVVMVGPVEPPIIMEDPTEPREVPLIIFDQDSAPKEQPPAPSNGYGK